MLSACLQVVRHSAPAARRSSADIGQSAFALHCLNRRVSFDSHKHALPVKCFVPIEQADPADCLHMLQPVAGTFVCPLPQCLQTSRTPIVLSRFLSVYYRYPYLAASHEGQQVGRLCQAQFRYINIDACEALYTLMDAAGSHVQKLPVAS
jgi:hypothetical protein